MTKLTVPEPALKTQAKRLRQWRVTSDVAIVLLVLVTGLWVYWGTAEMYFEGWWGKWTNRPAKLALSVSGWAAAGCATQANMAATSLCRYLSADGLQLLGEPQGIWRMPTVDEMVRSLARHGENAACIWDGTTNRSDCAFTPDKEPPLWDPDSSAVYYWAADEYNQLEAYYINYNGNAVQSQPKTFGNARHGYRCVRELTKEEFDELENIS